MDYSPYVNYSRSIAKEKLIYHKKGAFNYLLMRWFFVLIVLVLTYTLIDFVKKEDSAAIFLGLLDVFFIVSIYYQNKLVKVKGTGLLRNKEDIMITLRYFYKNASFDASEENIIRDIYRGNSVSAGRDVVVLLDNNIAYFHLTSLGRNNSILPLSGLYDYLKSKKIAAHFQKIQQNHKQEIPSS